MLSLSWLLLWLVVAVVVVVVEVQQGVQYNDYDGEDQKVKQ